MSTIRFLLTCCMNIIALFFVMNIVAGVSVDSWQAIVVAAVILGLLNTFLKPALILLTLPFNILSLGILTLFINGSMFYLAAKFVKGFHVISFWNAFWASIVFSVISFILSLFFAPAASTPFRMRSYTGTAPRREARYDNVIDVEGEVQKEEKENE